MFRDRELSWLFHIIRYETNRNHRDRDFSEARRIESRFVNGMCRDPYVFWQGHLELKTQERIFKVAYALYRSIALPPTVDPGRQSCRVLAAGNFA